MIANREQEIVLLSESGMSIANIARRMGLAESYVRGCVTYLCSGLGIDRSHERAMAAGSQALLAAITSARVQPGVPA